LSRWFLQVIRSRRFGEEAYDAGAKILQDFFQKCLADFQDPTWTAGKTNRQLLSGRGKLEDYDELIPGV